MKQTQERVLTLPNADLIRLLRDALDRDAPFRLTATGWSMHPFLKDGDVLTISPLSGTVPRTGDVIAFTPSGTDRLLIHRIVSARNGLFLLRGDNAYAPDGVISGNEIIGRVTRIERKGRERCFGLGRERYFVARCSRIGLIRAVLLPTSKMYHLFARAASSIRKTG